MRGDAAEESRGMHPGWRSPKAIRIEVDLAAEEAGEAEDAGAERDEGSRLGSGGIIKFTAQRVADDFMTSAISFW